MARVECPNFSPHDHTFGQDERRPGEARALAVALLTVVVMGVEIVAGLWTGSMALLADGVHMGTHAFALGLAVAAYVFTRRQAENRRYSFGTGKVNELAGFSSALVLGVSVALLLVEAAGRLLHPRPIAYDEAMLVAGIGLVVNVLSALALTGHHSHDDDHRHWHDDHNLRAAIVHVLADALTSVAAVVALLAARTSGWVWLDPLVALVACGVIAAWAWGLLRDTGRVLLDVEAPEVMRQQVLAALEADGDSRVADLHLWYVGQHTLTLVASVVTHDERSSADYKQRLPPALDIVHPVIDVVSCHSCRR